MKNKKSLREMRWYWEPIKTQGHRTQYDELLNPSRHWKVNPVLFIQDLVIHCKNLKWHTYVALTLKTFVLHVIKHGGFVGSDFILAHYDHQTHALVFMYLILVLDLNYVQAYDQTLIIDLPQNVSVFLLPHSWNESQKPPCTTGAANHPNPHPTHFSYTF